MYKITLKGNKGWICVPDYTGIEDGDIVLLGSVEGSQIGVISGSLVLKIEENVHNECSFIK